MKIKQLLFVWLCLVGWTSTVKGQSEFINYKAVIKDNNGVVIANSPVTVQFQVLRGAALDLFYTEEHSTTTDANGIIMLNIGNGTPLFQEYNRIDWGSGDHFLNVQIDTGSGYVDMGTTEFRAVPYALHATAAANVTGLEALDEGNGIGWRLLGRDPANFGAIGENAADFSFQPTSTSNGGALGTYAAAFGFATTATGSFSLATGTNADATGAGSFAMGSGTQASGNASLASGVATRAESFLSTAFGQYNVGGGTPDSWVITDPLFEIGNGTSTTDRRNALTLYKNGRMAVGVNSVAGGYASIAMGEDNVASGYASVALGFGATTTGEAALASGNNVLATGDHAFAIGRSNSAFGDYSAAFGINTTSEDDGAVSFGNGTRAVGRFSIATGLNSSAFGTQAVVMGESSTASGDNSLAIGLNAVSTGNAHNSIAVGTSSVTWNPSSGAFGNNANAYLTESFAFGSNVSTNGVSSFAAGRGVTASSAGEIVLGNYNETYTPASIIDLVSTDRLLVVGDGTVTNRSNAMVMLKNGNTGFGTNNPQERLHIANGRLRIGSETIEDAGGNLLGFNASLIPDLDDNFNLGTSSNRWNAVWAVDGTINTSDRRAKTDIETLDYGLKEVLAMKPVSYRWKEKPEQGEKLGLIAQDLLELVPEVVKTHEYVATDEEGTLELKPLERYGVYYADLIPVLINALQEQQEQIDSLKKTNRELSEMTGRLDVLEALLKNQKP